MKDTQKDKIELHVHLDGSVRLETILDLAKQRGIKLPADNVRDLAPYCQATNTKNLTEFLACFAVFTPTFIGDIPSIERISYEFCEDSAREGILYSEVRYSPHLLTGDVLSNNQVVEAVNRGLARGMKDFGITVRSILCCMRHMPGWSMEVLDLCSQYKDAGVVGIDLAGDEVAFSRPTHGDHIAAFQKAKELGVHRTVHAGENGPAANVKEAIEDMFAERIGHGYHTLDDPAVLQLALDLHIHFEVCPHSSVVTGSVDKDPTKHPLIKMCQCGASFSISTDDTTLTGLPLSEDYKLVTEGMKLTRTDIAKSNLNAAEAAFLPESEKTSLVAQIRSAYSAELS